MFEIRALFAGYPGKQVLSDLNLSIPSGKITVIAGPNGCGKSTLLKALAGILDHSGEISLDGLRLDGLPPRDLARKIAFLPQSRQIPEITAERLVLHGRFPHLSFPRRYRKRDLEIARDCLARMGISHLAEAPLHTLSGGTRQKVYIAMALAQDTPVILMDEPTTFLDVSHQMQTMTHARLLADSGKTVVLVLHDLPLALRHADLLAVMSGGTIIAADTPEQVFQSGCLDKIFGVNIRRMRTPEGWQYYYTQNETAALL